MSGRDQIRPLKNFMSHCAIFSTLDARSGNLFSIDSKHGGVVLLRRRGRFGHWNRSPKFNPAGPMTLESNPSSSFPSTPIPQLLLSPAEAAKALRMSKSKLYQMWKDDPANAPPWIKVGCNRRVSVAALHQWIAAQSSGTKTTH